MTRGYKATACRRYIRGICNVMILREERGCSRMRRRFPRGDKPTFARSVSFSLMAEEVAPELTPGPRGSGED
jgi:hypothetical protein